MKRHILLSLFAFSLGLLCYAGPVDSVGTKIKNGKIFILHKVEKSQGLFAISRLYNLPLNEIIESNPGSDEMLVVDQILLIPTGRDAPKEQKEVKDYFDNSPGANKSEPQKSEKGTFAKYHTVVKGETLYSISVLYKTKVDVLINLNNLTSNDISEGMELMVPSNVDDKVVRDDKIEKAQKKADSLGKEIKDVRNNIQSSDNLPADKLKSIGNSEIYERRVERLEEFDIEKIWEKGQVRVLDPAVAGKNTKVCSHHEAEIGTTIMVTNPINNKAVFVKVIDNHILNSSTGNIIILSQTAMDYVGLSYGATVEISFAR